MQRKNNPVFQDADAWLDAVLEVGKPLPCMVELIDNELYAYYCHDGQFGWYPISPEQLYALLFKRANVPPLPRPETLDSFNRRWTRAMKLAPKG